MVIPFNLDRPCVARLLEYYSHGILARAPSGIWPAMYLTRYTGHWYWAPLRRSPAVPRLSILRVRRMRKKCGLIPCQGKKGESKYAGSTSTYDGGFLPDRLAGLPDGVPLIRDGLGACILIGTKDTLISDCGGLNPRLRSGRIPEVTPYLRRVPGSIDYSDGPHEQDWIRACKESTANRIQGSAHFGYAGPFTEMVMLGVLAVRLKGLNKVLQWDRAKMEFANIGQGETMEVVENFGFRMVDGNPTWDVQHVGLNALDSAREYFRHTYKNGWGLPEKRA